MNYTSFTFNEQEKKNVFFFVPKRKKKIMSKSNWTHNQFKPTENRQVINLARAYFKDKKTCYRTENTILVKSRKQSSLIKPSGERGNGSNASANPQTARKAPRGGPPDRLRRKLDPGDRYPPSLSSPVHREAQLPILKDASVIESTPARRFR